MTNTTNAINSNSENISLINGIVELKATKKKVPRATTALAEKLRTIRLWKQLSQTEILRIVIPDADPAHRALVSQWENQIREPSRRTLIRYARFAEISLEELLVDERELPERIAAGAERSGAEAEDEEVEDERESASNRSNICPLNGEDWLPALGSDELSDDETDTLPQEPEQKNSAEHFELPFISSEEEPKEEITLWLPTTLLDQLDDARLQLLGLMPRRARPLLTAENIVGFSVKLLIHQNSQFIEEPLLVKQAKSLGEWWAQNKCDASNPNKKRSD